MGKKPDDFTPEPTFTTGERVGQRRCHGWSRSKDQQCLNAPMEGRDYCRMHGGKVPVGPALPQYRHGKRSKYFPQNIRERIEEAMEDEHLTEYRVDLALLEARLTQIVGGLHGIGTVADWNRLRKLVDGAYSVAETDPGRAQTLMARARDIIEQGAEDAAHWPDIYELLSIRRKTLDSHHKRQRDLMMYVSVDVFMGAITDIVATAHRVVTDPREKAAIGRSLDPWIALMNRQQGRA